MLGMEFIALSQQCAPDVHYKTMATVVVTESTYNPFAIALVDGRLSRQPKTKEEAVKVVGRLQKLGKNFSAGIGQVNVHNWGKYGLDAESVFDSCKNLAAASKIFLDCYQRAPRVDAKGTLRTDNQRIQAAGSCYYSGNFQTGYDQGYVSKLNRNAKLAVGLPVVNTKSRLYSAR